MPRHPAGSAVTSTRRDYSAPALEKGMDIIELLADAESGLTVSEIAQRLARSMSELFRIVVVLERRGWLQKDPETSRYRITYELLKLAHRGTPARTLTQVAAPVMHDLSTRINQSCHLVVRSGNQALVILRQENQLRHANLSVRLGAVIDLVTSCSGRVLLAHLEAAEREGVLAGIPKPWGLTAAELERRLARVRKRGYEIQRSTITAGVTDIGTPIRGFDGRVVASLTIPYLHALDESLPMSVDESRMAAEEAARRISVSLGGTR